MARTTLTPVKLSDAGLTINPTVAGTADGHEFRNTGKVLLVLENTGAGAHTVTIPTPATVSGLAVADRTISLAAGETKVAGPFDGSAYNQPSPITGMVFVDFDSPEAEVEVQAFIL